MATPYFVLQKTAQGQVKENARARLAQLDRMQKVGSDRAATLAKWVVASLLFLNGTAAVAVLDADAHIGMFSLFSILFCLGIIVSILNGWVVRVIVARQAAFLCRARAYWSAVLGDGVQIPTEEEALWRLSRKLEWVDCAIPMPALLSAGVFAWAYLAMMANLHGGI